MTLQEIKNKQGALHFSHNDAREYPDEVAAVVAVDLAKLSHALGFNPCNDEDNGTDCIAAIIERLENCAYTLRNHSKGFDAHALQALDDLEAIADALHTLPCEYCY